MPLWRNWQTHLTQNQAGNSVPVRVRPAAFEKPGKCIAFLFFVIRKNLLNAKSIKRKGATAMIDRTNRYYLTTAEMLVMRAIWLADHDMVLSEVVKACNAVYEKNWKPQTVSTYLSHLVQKEFLRMDRNGKIYSYHPIVKAQEYMKYDVQNFVEFWGLTPAEMMKNYLAIRGSSKEERDELRASIAKMEEEQSK